MLAHKILIAEDDPVMRKILSHTVESMGHLAINCPNGWVAMEMLRCNEDIGLLITDVAMPSMDGEQLVHCIRGVKALAHIPIIIISAVVSARQIAHLLESGASRFLAKPVHLPFLKDYILQLLQDDWTSQLKHG